MVASALWTAAAGPDSRTALKAGIRTRRIRRLAWAVLGVVVLVAGGGIAAKVWSTQVKSVQINLPKSARPLPDNAFLWRQRLADGSLRTDAVGLRGQVIRQAVVPGDSENRSQLITLDRWTILYLHEPDFGPNELRAISADGDGDRLLFRGEPTSARF